MSRENACEVCGFTSDEGDRYRFWIRYEKWEDVSFLPELTRVGEHRVTSLGERQQLSAFICAYCSTEHLLEKRRRARLIGWPLIIVGGVLATIGFANDDAQLLGLLGLVSGVAGVMVLWHMYEEADLRRYLGDLAWRSWRQNNVGSDIPATQDDLPLSGGQTEDHPTEDDLARLARWTRRVRHRARN